jgi:intracellular septation protein A
MLYAQFFTIVLIYVTSVTFFEREVSVAHVIIRGTIVALSVACSVAFENRAFISTRNFVIAALCVILFVEVQSYFKQRALDRLIKQQILLRDKEKQLNLILS